MLPAFITTFLWSFCVVAARRSVDQLGEDRANLYRLIVATMLLGILAHTFGGGLGGAGFWYFFLSGVIGFGLGDIGIYFALPRIGSRLTILLAQCGAAPVAGLAEWLWMGTVVSAAQIMSISIILAGITIALFPERGRWATLREGPFLPGVLAGVLAAVGQGMGAVFSRRAYEAAQAVGELPVDRTLLLPTEAIWLGATAGYQRLIGGLLLVVLFTAWRAYRGSLARNAPQCGDPVTAKGAFVFLNALTGPVLGIICFQWALATTPSVIVQPIIALTPIIVIPLAFWFEGDRPSPRSLLGGVVAVAGALVLVWA